MCEMPNVLIAYFALLHWYIGTLLKYPCVAKAKQRANDPA